MKRGRLFLWSLVSYQQDRAIPFRKLLVPKMVSTANQQGSPGFQIISLETYLEDTIKAIDPNFQLTLGEQHRKIMMRGIIGNTKVQMDEDLRKLRSKLHWDMAERFVLEDLNSLATPVDAPQFKVGLQNYKSYKNNHKKLFSYLAGGRVYQGKLASLLEKTNPELVPKYQQIVEEIPELELLKSYALEQDSCINEILLECIMAPFPKAPPGSEDGGQSRGKGGELSLTKYLGQTFETERILPNVFINMKKKNLGKSTTIQLPKSLNWDGMTSELDALVLQKSNRSIESVLVTQIWEAKATLHPISIHDALSKKHAAISKIFVTNGVTLYLDGNEVDVESGKLPKMGIFGRVLLSPKAAARRTQVILCEKLLGTRREVTENALVSGKISIPHEEVLNYLKTTLVLARDIQPTVVIASTIK